MDENTYRALTALAPWVGPAFGALVGAGAALLGAHFEGTRAEARARADRLEREEIKKAARLRRWNMRRINQTRVFAVGLLDAMVKFVEGRATWGDDAILTQKFEQNLLAHLGLVGDIEVVDAFMRAITRVIEKLPAGKWRQRGRLTVMPFLPLYDLSYANDLSSARVQILAALSAQEERALKGEQVLFLGPEEVRQGTDLARTEAAVARLSGRRSSAGDREF